MSLTGDLGTTFRSGQPVWPEIQRRWPINLEIMMLSVFFSTFFGSDIRGHNRGQTELGERLRVTYVRRVRPIHPGFLPADPVDRPAFDMVELLPARGGHVPFFEDPVTNLQLYLPPTLLLGIGGRPG